MDLISELKWRGMVFDYMPGTEEQLKKESTSVYLGIDPTADSLHVGHLAAVMLLKHFQMAGHKPILLVGGATGMIGDPSGKSAERNLLDLATIRHNQDKIKEQLSQLLNFSGPCAAEMTNNYDWMSPMSFLEFIRDIGKHITVNYMLAKDSVKKRLEYGLSFTEFTYQLVQGFDFYHLYTTKNCKIQIGGADQWGNITTGTELIRRKCGGVAFALTCPLITKSDGGKFGKTEQGNIWLDPEYTSPYKFYQFWLNVSDDDAKKYIRVFTLLDHDKIESLSAEHDAAPNLRALQKELAKQITILIHSQNGLKSAMEASEILFGQGTLESLKALDEKTFLQVFEGVPTFEVSFDQLKNGIPLADLLCTNSQVFPSKSELRRMIQQGGLNINKQKITDTDLTITASDLMNDKYLLVQKGKKIYFLIKAK